MSKQLTLTAGEISFLRWLRDNGGTGSRSGNNWLGTAERLIRAGYVEVQMDRSRPDTLHYRLTDGGREALAAHRPS